MTETALRTRRAAIAQALATPTFDLLVIGGGINGAAIARDAALRGLAVALVERGDFASGTSSKSSKLIHGGLRYLENFEFALVLEASRERDRLRRRLAPHLVHPMPFVFPVFAGDPVGRLRLAAGLWVYDGLAAFRNIARHRSWGRRATLRHEPHLRADGLQGAMHYYDCWTDDARLTLETVLAAASAGAVVCNYIGVSGFLHEGGQVAGARVADRLHGGSYTIRARQVVNATGPWLDQLRALDDPKAPPVLRLTKGVHILVPRERIGNTHAIVLRAPGDGRVMFAIPWDTQTLIGTTDTDYINAPDDVVADAADVRYLLDAANHYFPAARLEERDVVGAYAGLRPLVAPTGAASPSDISREEEIFESAWGLVSLGGGKLTTHRRVAERVVDLVVARLCASDPERRVGPCVTAERPLPGALVESPELGGFPGFAKRVRAGAPSGFDDALVRHLLDRYGTSTPALLALLAADAEARAPLVPSLPYRRGEVTRAAADEMAVTLDDVLRRRVPVAFRDPSGGLGVVDEVAARMQSIHGWGAEETAGFVERYREGIRAEQVRRKATAPERETGASRRRRA